MIEGTYDPKVRGKRSHHVSPKATKGKILCRSTYEERYAVMLDADPDVISYETESIRIPYAFEGSTRNYVPDFVITRASGAREIVEVKAAALLDHGSNSLKFSAARDFCTSRGLTFRVVTEHDLLTLSCSF
jgi:hypothetical protein